ncbi:MAG: 3-methyl-2-oxobutanoate hydroxymethyltransferase [candidate division Zixibacteria bacterium]|nr:3-methyl-2-oxobutanoate hydroxymethyltransferase [candidate division Zixibacteria bacterium]
MAEEKITVRSFAKFKQKGEKIAILTAYDFFTAHILDQIGMGAVLVGDSVNMVFYGSPNTLSISMDQMIYHTKAVTSAVSRALVIADMPFLSYQASTKEAILNAGRFLKEGGAGAVKIEGGLEMADTIKRIIEVGIPVMGHIGLTPQSINRFGGYVVRGKSVEEKKYLMESAKKLEQIGCFSVLVESVPKKLAQEITQSLKVPTIGIGAGDKCDGQVLVVNDILGLFEDFKPKFVRRYAELGKEIRKACKNYLNDVKSGRFPSDEESYQQNSKLKKQK